MAQFGLFDNLDSSPGSTPVIEESEFSFNSFRSTPCPPGRDQDPGSSTPRGRARFRDNNSEVAEPVVLVPDSTIAPPGSGRQQEKNDLRDSMATLRVKLANSTALINNLRTRNDVFQAENTAKEAQLKEAREEADSIKAVADSATEEGEAFRRFVFTAVSFVVLIVVAYSYWCWYNGPEMQYVLRRRREVLGI